MTAETIAKALGQLNDRWRVIDDPLQGIVQYRRDKHGSRDEGGKDIAWEGKRFFRTHTALIRDIGELCGSVDPRALAVIEATPDRHVDRDRSRQAS